MSVESVPASEDATLEIVQMEVGLLQNFCEVIGCPATGEAAFVDPAFEVDRLLAAAEQRGWKVTSILLTHTHDDHIAGLDEAVAATGAVVRCHPVEVERVRAQAAKVEAVSDGERVAIGRGVVQALYTPGHTPGCVCWYLPEPGAVITGDVLFVGSCGGVSYPGSDPAAMVDSLQRRLGDLPEETKLYPGHDYGETPTSTLAWERLHNPALTNETVEAFCRYKRVRG
ncbi:hydroxyacylglutathione hydrolase family protein [Haliangium ochraceum]|uniref:Hydroxyacylglutathione hydrolase n=1 Tax=Haliangium ochraceum (strain DSM 14365 / JCM 11303 / SMP-2) TaxID=502025 RepID=D0LJN4_HALO1|nr:hydroxyacylglutathione hydrolase family protein [Haliangium ochraceum]ACY16608.1 Hydroxyacylglutathione hydrolase [Haliangium ochraceum DSM 14365]